MPVNASWDVKVIAMIGVVALVVGVGGLISFTREVSAMPKGNEQACCTVGELREALSIFAKYANDDDSKVSFSKKPVVSGAIGPNDMREHDAEELSALGWKYRGQKSWELDQVQVAVDILTRAARGLEYPSETDAPFVVIGPTAKRDASLAAVCSALKDKPPECVKKTTLEAIFDFDCDYEDDAAAFRAEIEKRLTSINCYRVGPGPVIRIYIIGRAKTDGQIVVIKTTSVET